MANFLAPRGSISSSDAIIDLSKNSRIEKWSVNNLKFSLYLSTYDAMSIYKGTYRNTHKNAYRHHLSPGIKYKAEGLEALLPLWSKILFVFQVYMIVKCLLIIVIQLILHGSEGSSWIHRLASEAGKTIGNPLSNIFGLSLVSYSICSTSVAYFYIYLPYIYTIRPMDASIIRLIMNPVREIKRIDAVIEEKFIDLLAMIDSHNDTQKGCWLDNDRIRMIPDWFRQDRMRKEHELRNVLMYEKDLSWSLRPASFYYKNLKKLYLVMICESSSFVIVSNLFGMLICPYLLMLSFERRCLEKKLSGDCSFMEVYSGADALSLIEVVALISQSIFIFNSVAGYIIKVVAGGVINVNNMRTDFELYLGHLREVNSLLFKRGILLDVKTRENLSLSLDVCLIRILVKIDVLLDEIRRNATFIKDSVQCLIVIAGGTIISALLAAEADGDVRTFRYVLFVIVWVITNVVGLACSYLFAKLINLDKFNWSILAEVMRHDMTQTNSFLSSKIRAAWHRFVISNALNDGRNSINPMGFRLDFKKVLELNFMILSFAVLLRQAYKRH